MFNNYYIGGDTTNNKCEVHLNAPSTGFIQKSNPVSRFIRFQRGSEIEKLLFPTDPREVPKLTYTRLEKNEYSHSWKDDYREVSEKKWKSLFFKYVYLEMIICLLNMYLIRI